MRAVPIVLSLVLASASALAFAFGGGESGGTDPVEPPPPVNTAFAGVLVRVGLGADTLAAAGITQNQVASLVSALEDQFNPATLASLDDPERIAPALHMWTSSQLSWLEIADDLPRHEGQA